MRLPVGWMAEYVDLSGIDPEQLADRLSLSGTAVEDVHAGALAGDLAAATFRVGHVVSVDPHPDADRLRVCQVDVGQGVQQIVCGAPNVAAGQRVPVALPGAVMPGGQKLGVAKLRGVESNGMICSATELGVGAEADGIMVLAGEVPAGTPLAEVLPAAAETVLELELTSNRPDCMSIGGMAREAAAVLDVAYAAPRVRLPEALAPGHIAEMVGLRVEAPDLCPRYMARAFLDVEVGPSPAWLAARVESAGMRSISNVVDVTNYVMLLTGQPLHAFDLDRMAGPEIVVRRAGDGEKVTTLDGVERVLTSSMLAICDADSPGVIAGIMGAADVEVSEATTRVLLEAANFHGPNIIQTSLDLGLRSESSSRFEKGLPPRLTELGLDMASELLVALCGASLVPGTLDAREPLPEAPRITLRHARTNLLLGDRVDPGEGAAILRRLGCEVSEGADAHEVVPPWHRADLTREADLIEEIGRIRGYQRITPRLPRTSGAGRRTPAQEIRERVTRVAADQGYDQAITYSMVPEGDADRLRMDADDPRREVIRLAHPLSEEMGVMRRSMLPGLLRAAALNQHHQSMSGAIFEIGRTYAPAADGLADERRWLAALAFGEPGADHWRRPSRPVDFFTAKGLIEVLAEAAGVALVAEPNAANYFSPGRQARMISGEHTVGWAGEVHPLVLREFDVKGPTAAVVLDLEALAAAAAGPPAAYADLPTVPVSTRDLALIVSDGVPAADILATARAADTLVRDAAVFDLYAGEQVPDGKVSLAVRLVIADLERTLTDEEIDGALAAAVEQVTAAHGAELRS